MFIQDEEDEALDSFFTYLNWAPFFWLFYFSFFLILHMLDMIIGIGYLIIRDKRP